jgi:hypothetical protein
MFDTNITNGRMRPKNGRDTNKYLKEFVKFVYS